MHADFSVELGRDDPALELPWNSADPLVRYHDLKRHPELVSQIPEAAAHPELSAFLARINAAGFPLATAKCDAWSSMEVSPEEEIYGDRKFVSYVDLVFEADSVRGSLEKHETFAKELCRVLGQAPNIAATVELVIRRCYYYRRITSGATLVAGNVEAPDVESGYREIRDTKTRDDEERDGESGDAEVGDAEAGQAQAAPADVRDSEVRGSEVRDSEARDVEEGDGDVSDSEVGVAEEGNAEVGDADHGTAKAALRLGAVNEESTETACRQMIQRQNRGPKIEEVGHAHVSDQSASRHSVPRQPFSRESDSGQSASGQSGSGRSASRQSGPRAEEKREFNEDDNVGASGLPSRLAPGEEIKPEDSTASDNGFCFTVYVSGFGDIDHEPQRLWVIALALLQHALVQLSSSWSF